MKYTGILNKKNVIWTTATVLLMEGWVAIFFIMKVKFINFFLQIMEHSVTKLQADATQ